MSENIPFWLKTTPLYEVLKEAGGQFVDFAGYYMPVNFTNGIVSEHQAVRENVAFFDISHMGEILVTGKDASKFINYVSTNNISKVNNYEMQYQVVCYSDGGAVDDLMAYKYNENKILLVCNASNKDNLLVHLNELKSNYDVVIADESENYAAIAVQGPKSLESLEDYFSLNQLEYLKFGEFDNFIISRSGYTGEDGFEVYGSPSDVVKLTKWLLDDGVMPAGLGSRDTLRFEAGLPLYGHEMADYISPIQAGMNFAVDFSKDDFIGKEALLKQKEHLESKIYGLELISRGIARQGHEVFLDGVNIGFITSGFMIPGTKNSFANALLKGSYKFGDVVQIEVRGKMLEAKIRRKKYLNKK